MTVSALIRTMFPTTAWESARASWAVCTVSTMAGQQSCPGLEPAALYEKHRWGIDRFRTCRHVEPLPLPATLPGAAQELDRAFARREGVKRIRIVAPPIFALLAADAQGRIVPSQYAANARAAGLDIITWSLERSGISPMLVSLSTIRQPSQCSRCAPKLGGLQQSRRNSTFLSSIIYS